MANIVADMPRLLTATLPLLLLTSTASAEPPDVTFLFPAGVQQGQSRALKLHGKTGTAPTRGWTSHDSLALQPNEDGTEATLTATADALPGLYFARIANDEGVSNLLPLVVGVLPESVESDWQTDAGPQPVTLPTTISGVLSKGGEVDSYNVALTAGQTLVASIDSHRLLASPADPVLQLVSDAGFVIAQNDDHHEIDPQLVHTATSDETLTLRVFSFPADPNSSIALAGGESYVYRLTLTIGPFVDHVLPLTANEATPTLQPFGWNLPEDAPPISITPPDAPLPITSTHPGTLLPNRIDRTSFPALIEPADVTSTEPVAVQPLMLPIPGNVSGRIAQPGEIDAYTIEATKNQKLLITVAARRFDAPLDPVLSVLDSEGKLVKEFDDVAKGNADVLLPLTIPADGTYRLEVRDRFAHGGLRHVYLLQVEPDAPRVNLSVKDSRYTLAAGAIVEIPVTIERLAGFDQPIQFTVEGLPEGITAEPIESAAEGDTAKAVTLKLTSAETAQFSGPIRILAQAGETPPLRATTPTPVAGLTIGRIWLTVTPAPKPDTDPPAENQ